MYSKVLGSRQYEMPGGSNVAIWHQKTTAATGKEGSSPPVRARVDVDRACVASRPALDVGPSPRQKRAELVVLSTYSRETSGRCASGKLTTCRRDMLSIASPANEFVQRSNVDAPRTAPESRSTGRSEVAVGAGDAEAAQHGAQSLPCHQPARTGLGSSCSREDDHHCPHPMQCRRSRDFVIPPGSPAAVLHRVLLMAFVTLPTPPIPGSVNPLVDRRGSECLPSLSLRGKPSLPENS